MSSSTTTVTQMPSLKKDAVIHIEVGSVFFQKIQAVQLFLREGHTEEEMAELKRLIEAKLPLTGWMAHLASITFLLSGLAKAASEQGLVEYKDVNLADSLQELQSQ